MFFGSGYLGGERGNHGLSDASVADSYIGDSQNMQTANIEGTQSSNAVIGVKELGMSVTEGN